jgi:hypothetical protein
MNKEQLTLTSLSPLSLYESKIFISKRMIWSLTLVEGYKDWKLSIMGIRGKGGTCRR